MDTNGNAGPYASPLVERMGRLSLAGHPSVPVEVMPSRGTVLVWLVALAVGVVLFKGCA